MKTLFKFSTGVALDDSADYPLKYNFQILFDGIKISIGAFYENMVTTTLLPFSGWLRFDNEDYNDLFFGKFTLATNISTMYEVCDSREACSTVNGPRISTTMPLDNDINLDDILSNIRASMSRMEYEQSFGFALMAGITLKVYIKEL